MAIEVLHMRHHGIHQLLREEPDGSRECADRQRLMFAERAARTVRTSLPSPFCLPSDTSRPSPTMHDHCQLPGKGRGGSREGGDLCCLPCDSHSPLSLRLHLETFLSSLAIAQRSRVASL